MVREYVTWIQCDVMEVFRQEDCAFIFTYTFINEALAEREESKASRSANCRGGRIYRMSRGIPAYTASTRREGHDVLIWSVPVWIIITYRGLSL